MAAFPTFIGPTYQSASPLVAAERCVNWYPEKTETPNAVAPWALYPTPGLVPFGAGSVEGPGRGLFAMDGRCFAAQGQAFYEVNGDGTLTNRGAIARDANPITIGSSGTLGGVLILGSAGNVYSFNLVSNTLSAAVGGLTAQQVGYMNGRFLALDPATSILHVSNLLDPTTWVQANQRSQAADNWQAMLVIAPYIWLFGSQTTDVFYDTGVAPQPFAPYPGVLIQYGIAAPYSAVAVDGQPIWLSQNVSGQAMVLAANGLGAPQRISTHAVELAIQGYGNISDARAFTYQARGHTFYILTFPTPGKTWGYDKASGLWHEREYLNPQTGRREAWRPAAHAYAFGQHVVSDRATGALYTLSDTTYTDAGGPIRRLRRTTYVTDRYTQNYYEAFQVLLQVGVGVQMGQGSDPKLMFRMSRDGGFEYGVERMASIGKAGEYLTRARFTRLGRARGNPVFEVSVSDPVFAALYGADVDVTMGLN